MACCRSAFQCQGKSSCSRVCRHLTDTGKDVGEPGLGLDVVELRGADEGVHHGRPLAAAIGAREQPGLALETDATQRPLGGVICGTDATVVEEAGEAAPAPQL